LAQVSLELPELLPRDCALAVTIGDSVSNAALVAVGAV